MLFPSCVDDYVNSDNPARAIDSYVDSLNLTELGFAHSSGNIRAGQLAYDPSDLLKLYIYGYLNRVRSSRRLENEISEYYRELDELDAKEDKYFVARKQNRFTREHL